VGRPEGTGVYGATIAALFALEFVCIYWGFMFTTAARGVLFIYATPFFVALGAHWLFPAERLHGTKIAGLIAAFAGLSLAFADGLRLPTHREVLGTSSSSRAPSSGRRRPHHQGARPGHQSAPDAVLPARRLDAALGALAMASGECGVTGSPAGRGAVLYQIVAVARELPRLVLMLTRCPASDLHAYTFWTLFGLVTGGPAERAGELTLVLAMARGAGNLPRQPRRRRRRDASWAAAAQPGRRPGGRTGGDNPRSASCVGNAPARTRSA
jgi:hypothetical protein